MRIMAIDYGDAHTGIAVSDPTGFLTGFTTVIDAYRRLDMGDGFFTSFFELLIGVDYVRPMIRQGRTASEIRARWQEDVRRFKTLRKPYLLYEE